MEIESQIKVLLYQSTLRWKFKESLITHWRQLSNRPIQVSIGSPPETMQNGNWILFGVLTTWTWTRGIFRSFLPVYSISRTYRIWWSEPKISVHLGSKRRERSCALPGSMISSDHPHGISQYWWSSAINSLYCLWQDFAMT